MKEQIKIKKVKPSHRKIYTDIIIDASAEQVWDVLRDTKSYQKWAAFLVDIEGELINGREITAKFQLDPKKKKFNTIKHTIQVKNGEEFYWAEKGPMGICDNHHFKVEAIDARTSRFIQNDELTKGATWILGGYLSKVYAKGYQAFNRQLKKEAEFRFELNK